MNISGWPDKLSKPKLIIIIDNVFEKLKNEEKNNVTKSLF